MNPTNVIWIQTSFLGDIVLTTAAMRLLAHCRPGVHQHLVTTGIGSEALSSLPFLKTIHVFEKRRGAPWTSLVNTRRSLITALPKNRKDCLVLQPHRSFRSSLLARSLGVHTITYRETTGAVLAHTRVPRVALHHEAARIALLLEPLGISREDIVAARPWLPSYSPPDHQLKDWQHDLANSRQTLVALAPGSVWFTKRWPVEGFCELARRLHDDPTITLVLLGSKAEAPLTREIETKLGASNRVVDLAGKTSLDELRWIFPRLSLLVSNDSSPIHYASAFSVPTVAIFGATVPAMGFGPMAEGSCSVGTSISCRPCSDHGPEQCPLGHFRCMRELTAELVYQSCRDHLVPKSRSPQSPSPGKM